MFDIGWTELVVIGVVALIVIGPKDLPEMFRTLGRVTGKLRAMARDFQRVMEQAANESGVKDVAKDLKTMTSPKSLGIDAVKDAATRFEKWDPLKPAKPAAAKPAAPVAAAAAPAAAPTEAPAAATEARPMGPATQALYDAKAARKAAKEAPATDVPAKAPAKSKAPAKMPAKAAVPAKPAAPAKAKAPAKPAATPASAAPAKPRAKPRPKPEDAA